MSLDIKIQQEDGYLYIHVRGQCIVNEVKELTDVIKLELEQRGYDHVLVDMLEVGPPEMNMDRYWIGSYAAEVFRGKAKLAALYKKEFTNKFAESVARNRGLDIYVSEKKEVALKWLLNSGSI